MDEKITFKTWIKRTEGNLTVNDFFSDGIHPSAVAYGIWGKEVALFIEKNVF